ncbi:hypothetical protein M951_chr1153 (nucleomorph) [Lotharella oceanica]|nr:hypothetical protein M951_chr1153 [Lotharella oceanica]
MIIKKIFNRNIQCKITIFMHNFFIPDYYTNTVICKNKFYKIYNFKFVRKIQNTYLYFARIGKNKWLNLIFSVIEINSRTNLLIIFQNKQEAKLLHMIIQEIFYRKEILYISKTETLNYLKQKTSKFINKNNIIIITSMESIDKISEIKVSWVLIPITDFDLKYKKLKENIKKLKFFKKIHNILLISSIEKNKLSPVHYLTLFKTYNFKKFILLDFSLISDSIQKKKNIRKKINIFFKNKIINFLQSNNIDFYQIIQKILIYSKF